jgi:hypothetical protein
MSDEYDNLRLEIMHGIYTAEKSTWERKERKYEIELARLKYENLELREKNIELRETILEITGNKNEDG